MHPALLQALDRAIAGDTLALQGFGLEKATFVHPHWEDRLTIDGAGVATATTRRSAADGGGEPIGLFRETLQKPALAALLGELKKLFSGPLPEGGRAEPSDPRLVLTVVAGGEVWELVTGTQPEQLAPLDALLLPLTQTEMAVFQKPVRAAVAELKGAKRTKSKSVSVQIALTNPGSEGAWVSHPHALAGGERVSLTYLPVPKTDPNVQAIPQVPERAPLRAPRGTPAAPRYLWLEPGKTQVFDLEADVVVPARDTVCRVELHLDTGPDVVAGKPRLRGSLFTRDALLG